MSKSTDTGKVNLAKVYGGHRSSKSTLLGEAENHREHLSPS